MKVSVVIPTIGRPELRRAIDSVLQQTRTPFELIVVDDGAAATVVNAPTTEASFPVRVLQTDGRQGAAVARNIGINAARGELVALLDDDDWWTPDKLALQVRSYEQSENPSRTLVGCRQVEVTPGGRIRRTTPRRLIDPGESVASYLFERRRVMPGETGIWSSTLLASRELFVSVQFDALPRHQDWDWVLRAERLEGAIVTIHPSQLVMHTRQPVGESISSGGTWQSSLDWVTANSSYLTDRQQADTILCVTAAIAAHSGEWSAIPALSRKAWRLGAGPAAWLAIVGDCALTGLRRAWHRPASTGP